MSEDTTRCYTFLCSYKLGKCSVLHFRPISHTTCLLGYLYDLMIKITTATTSNFQAVTDTSFWFQLPPKKAKKKSFCVLKSRTFDMMVLTFPGYRRFREGFSLFIIWQYSTKEIGMKNNDRSSIFRLKRRRFLGGIGTLSDTRFCCDCIRVLYITHPSTVFGIQVSNTHQNAPFVIHVNI